MRFSFVINFNYKIHWCYPLLWLLWNCYALKNQQWLLAVNNDRIAYNGKLLGWLLEHEKPVQCTVWSFITGRAVISCRLNSSTDWLGWGLMSSSVCPQWRGPTLSEVSSMSFRWWPSLREDMNRKSPTLSLCQVSKHRLGPEMIEIIDCC